MSDFSTKAALKAATLQAGQRVRTNGLDVVADGGHQEFYVQTLADYGGVAPDETLVSDVLLANGNVAKALGVNALPLTGIILWPSEVAPDGWALCDGTNGTVDLRGIFALMPTDPADVLSILGDHNITLPSTTNSHTLTTGEVPSQSLAIEMDASSQSDSHFETSSVARGRAGASTSETAPISGYTGGGGGHTHTIEGLPAFANIPASRYINFIMRISEITQVVNAQPPEGAADYINVSGDVELDAQFGDITVFVVQPNADIDDLIIINPPAADGTAYAASIKIISDGASTVTFNATQFKWGVAGVPTLTGTLDNWDWIVAISVDQGVTFDANLAIEDVV